MKKRRKKRTPRYVAVFHELALADYNALRSYDKRPITAALQQLEYNPYPPKTTELGPPYEGLGYYRIWVGKWRIIYSVDDNAYEVFVLRILKKTGPETYHNLPELL
jgi:mRNA-degrading endonuclease RelE of RelBE toxin-antitoxin system